MNFLARFVSVVFHPLLMATYLCALFIYLMPTTMAPLRMETFGAILLLIFLVTFILPAANIIVFRIFGSISTFSMVERKERQLPFVFISLLYVLMTFLFHRSFGLSFSDSFFKLLLVLDILVIVATVITFFYKISVHSMGIWGALGVLIPLNQDAADGILFYPVLILIVIAGTVMTARLHLQVHSVKEVTTGAVLGFALSYGSMILLY